MYCMLALTTAWPVTTAAHPIAIIMAHSTTPDTVGREYLLKLREKASRERERQTKARALSVQVHKLFNPLEEEVSCKKVDADGMLLDIAHLIDSKCVERYQNKYAAATQILKDCRMQLSGPWPPYHFVHKLIRPCHQNPVSAPAAVSHAEVAAV